MIYIYIVPCIRWDHRVLYTSVGENILDNQRPVRHQIAAPSPARQRAVEQRVAAFPSSPPWHLGCCTV